MKKTALLVSESSPITSTSPSFPPSGAIATTTQVAPCFVYFVDFSKPLPVSIPKSSRSFSNFVAELEKDSAIAKHLSDARVEMAKEVDAINENGIRQMRMNLGWPQSRLANEIGTTQAHIARIESGKSDVQMGTLIRIAAALGVNAKEVCAAYLVYCSAAS